MNIVLLGAGNFIGQRVSQALRTLPGLSLKTFERLPDAAALAATLGDCAVAVNCTIGAPQAITDAASLLCAQATSLANPPRIVHLSSMTVYGSATGLIAEQAALRDDLSPYASAQIGAERQAAACPRAVILRPGCEYGPGCPQWSERVARWLLARRLGDLGDAGRGRCNLLFIDDLVAAIIAAIDLPGIEGEAFNLAGPDAPSWNEYFVAFATALGVTPVASIPASKLSIETKLYAVPLKVLEIFLGKLGGVPAWLPPAIPPSLPGLCRQDIRLDVAKATSKLGLRWTAMNDGLRAAASAQRRS